MFRVTRQTELWRDHKQISNTDIEAICQTINDTRRKSHTRKTLLAGGKVLSVTVCSHGLLIHKSYILYLNVCLFFSVSKLLLNAASYDGEIWHAAACWPCPGLLLVGSLALLVARRTNDRKVAGSRPTKVVCITCLLYTSDAADE